MYINKQKSYSTDNIRGLSEIAETNGYMGNYNTAYKGGMSGNVLLDFPDYTNPKNLLHNNVGDSVLLAQLSNNKLFIDSSIRDFSKSPEPYRFVVKFNGIVANTQDISVTVNGEIFKYPKYLSGDTDVVMDRMFKNVKYITINNLILPKCITFKKKIDGIDVEKYIYEKDENTIVEKYKYITLKIAELVNNNCYSNNKAFGKESIILKIYNDRCNNNNIWEPIFGASNSIVYPESKLMTITRLTVEICDDRGVRLCPTLDGVKHDFFSEYIRLIDQIAISQMPPPQIPILSSATILSLLPKLRSIKDIVDNLSPELHITIGVMESQINTQSQFRS